MAKLLQAKQYANIPRELIWFTILFCALPSLLNIAGVRFGMESPESPAPTHGAFIAHIVLVCISITLAALTVILAYIDFYVKGDVSTPVVGIALFCASLLDVSSLLYLTKLIHISGDLTNINSFPWLFSRTFHASIIMLGTGIFLIRPNMMGDIRSSSESRQFILQMGIIFILLTFLTVFIFLTTSDLPDTVFEGQLISRPYDLIPLVLYFIAGWYILPRFTIRYPSIFAQTLLLAMLPSVITQLHMSLGSRNIYDNHFFIAYYTRTLSYFLPFLGLGLNYFQVSRNEKKVIAQLYREANEKRRTQEMLKGVLDSSLNGIMVFKPIRDEHHMVVDFECQMNNLASLDIASQSRQMHIGERMSDIFRNHFYNGLFEQSLRVMKNRIPEDQEYYSEQYDRWYHIITTHIEEGVTVTFNDITDLKGYEKELEKRINDLDRSNKELEQFAYVASHDLQEPLRKIRSFGERLNDQYRPVLGEKGEDYLNRMSSAAERMQVLIDDLLLFSRISRATDPFEICNLEAIAKDVIGDFELTIAEKNALILVNPLPTVKAIPTQMRQLLHNLIGNALKFAREGIQPYIVISSKEVNAKTLKSEFNIQTTGSYNQITISDNGIGFDPQYRKKIFLIFQRLHGITSYTGTGIGLAICKRITDTHKGWIIADAVEGKGATFTIILPHLKNPVL